jgi:hypothetical protein
MKYAGSLVRDNINQVLSPVSLILGVAFFGLVAVFLGASATGAASIPLLGVLWIFAPAPIVFAWLWWSKERTPNPRL